MLGKLKELFGLKLVAPPDAIEPNGLFEILGSRCVGVVIDSYNPFRQPIRIVVENTAGKAKYELEVSRQSRGNRYEFSFDLDLSITGEDLLRERTVIWAINAFGHKGRLKMDGGSQLTLIRRYLSRPRELMFDIDFTQGGNAEPYKRGGWSNPEQAFCWTDGHQAKLLIPVNIAEQDSYELTLNCSPMLYPPILERQDVTVTLNGFAHHATFDTKASGFANFIFRAGSLLDNTMADITFDLPHAEEPAKLRSDTRDRRLLGLSFKQLTFARLIREAETAAL